MATNDFLPFAYGGGANVLSQSAYSALTTLLSGGYQSGVANSAQMNKTWRQSSIMAAVLGQFSADYSGQNSTDDGTTATLETNLVAAIRSATKTGVLLADTGAANAYTATNVPALTSLVNGLVQQVTIAHANTGASTYAPDGLTAAPIYGLALQPLQGGELFVGGTAVLVRATIAGVNTGNPIWVLMECAGGAQQIAPATQSQHAPQAGQVQRSAFNYAGLAGGTANAITATLNVAPTSYTDYLIVTVRIASTNTGSVSLNVNGLGVVPVIGQGHQTLQGGELVAGGFATFAYSQNFSEAILLASTGGPVQVGAATQSQHAVQLGQVSGVIGSVRNLVMSVTAASATATLTADEIIVETALGGLRYCLANFSKAINLATTGAGGMDTGSAPVSGYVALYAIYNPTTQTAALLAKNATSAAQPNVYGGANMPAGYTASALVSVWPTNGSGQFIAAAQQDRIISIPLTQILSGSTQQASFTPLSIAGVVPPNAKGISGLLQAGNSVSSNCTLELAGSTGGVGQQGVGAAVTAGNVAQGSFANVPLFTAQTVFYTASATGGTLSSFAGVTGYNF